MDVKEYTVEVVHNKQNHPWEYARFEVMMDVLKQNFPKGKGSFNIIDIGCGDAFFLHQLSKRFTNCNFFAVDTAFTPDMLAVFQEKYKGSNIKFYQNLSDFSAKYGSVDLIFLMDVIEHIEDDVAMLSSLCMLPGFHKDTLVAVTVPAFQSLFSSHDKWLGHYRRYSIKMLKQHLHQAGFTPVRSGYFFFSLLVLRTLQKMKEFFVKSNTKHVVGIGDWNRGRFLSTLLKNILVFDYILSKIFRQIFIKLPGLSCYCISKPSHP